MISIPKLERDLSFKVERVGNKRSERYLKREVGKSSMNKFVGDFINSCIDNKKFPTHIVGYIMSSSKYIPLKGNALLAKYHDNYIMVFLGINGLDDCGIRLTYSKKENEIFEKFMYISNEDSMSVFKSICIHLAFDNQKIALLKGAPTYGIIHSTYPDDGDVVDSVVRYVNVLEASKVANPNYIYAVASALDRGVTISELNDIIPCSPEYRFLNAPECNFQLAQIEALESRIAEGA